MENITSPSTLASDDKTNILILKLISLLLATVPIFGGVAYGIREAVVGVCQSAELRLDISLTIIPFAFISACLIYAMIVFFVLYSMVVNDYPQALKMCACGAISGIGGMFSAYAIGGIAKYACITRAQQKKFTTQFFLMMIFAELIGIFGLIMAIAAKSV